MICEEFRNMYNSTSPLATSLDERKEMYTHFIKCEECQDFVNAQPPAVLSPEKDRQIAALAASDLQDPEYQKILKEHGRDL